MRLFDWLATRSSNPLGVRTIRGRPVDNDVACLPSTRVGAQLETVTVTVVGAAGARADTVI